MLQKFVLHVNSVWLLPSVCVLGVFCGFSINLPQTVEALQGSCVFIPCTFDIDQQYEHLLTDRAKRIWFKEGTLVFDSSSPDTGLLKWEIFGTATQKNCTTRFDNVNQSHNGSYYFRLEDDKVKYNFKKSPPFQVVVLGECHIVHAASSVTQLKLKINLQRYNTFLHFWI